MFFLAGLKPPAAYQGFRGERHICLEALMKWNVIIFNFHGIIGLEQTSAEEAERCLLHSAALRGLISFCPTGWFQSGAGSARLDGDLRWLRLLFKQQMVRSGEDLETHQNTTRQFMQPRSSDMPTRTGVTYPAAALCIPTISQPV